MDKYNDIINLPHHVSEGRTHLTMAQRAAQFSPFAALTGYDAEVKEAGRSTSPRIELDEAEKERIDRTLQTLTPEDTAIFTVFVPDALKDGGEYIMLEGAVKQIDPIERVVILTDGSRIPLDNLMGVEHVQR